MITRRFLPRAALMVWCAQPYTDDTDAVQLMPRGTPEARVDLVVKGVIGRRLVRFSLETLMQRPPVTIVQECPLTGKTSIVR